ncbi:hypothetical protein FE633_14955 [Streptomyces montanus]|uniref:Spore-associated protein A n=1 Tax=Streptomyces montanus TaxID=2580423 RepID=A0A5R9FRR6_9ACTN|nr:hypothetical protein [Streptomyces montanus]TLS45369.1 hypothetical protein FE633_14955 [Streptomyces montanus]
MIWRERQLGKATAACVAGLMACASLLLSAPQASARTICYDDVDTVPNKYGQTGGSGRASFCYDDATGYFETNTGQNWVKDHVNGDGVAARLVLVYERPGGPRQVEVRKTDTVSTPGATSWAWSGYFDYVGAYVCLGHSQPGTGSYCNLLYDTTGFSEGG